MIDVIKVIGKERLSYHRTDESAESLSNEIMFRGVILKISYFFFLTLAILTIENCFQGSLGLWKLKRLMVTLITNKMNNTYTICCGNDHAFS